MNIVESYLSKIEEILEKIRKEERDNFAKTAELISEAVEGDNLIHVFGTGGHSVMAAMEVFYRAGGLACINPIFPPRIISYG